MRLVCVCVRLKIHTDARWWQLARDDVHSVQGKRCKGISRRGEPVFVRPAVRPALVLHSMHFAYYIRLFIIRESAVLGYGVKRGLCSRGGVSSQRPGSEATGNTRARPPVENSIQRRVDIISTAPGGMRGVGRTDLDILQPQPLFLLDCSGKKKYFHLVPRSLSRTNARFKTLRLRLLIVSQR